MTVPEDVREALVEDVQSALADYRSYDDEGKLRRSAKPIRWDTISADAVDAVLAHLEPVGWWCAAHGRHPYLHGFEPKGGTASRVYRIHKDAP